ncbi:MAG: CxxxxCH/CxxCH domain-containing protein [Nitrospiraceae bacterium]|nr:MAG: CxxxxCH/CxxCH domain-containing protein [Nitrospiraceae bacterium]
MIKKYIIILALVSTSVLVTVQSHALDYPHNNAKSVSCEDCHYIWGSEPSLMIEGLTYGNDIDDTHYNALCWSCHENATAPLVETHSSLQTDNGYGDWTVECIECHDAHGNYQFRTYGSASYIFQGSVSLVNATTLTLIGAGWTVDEFKDLVLVPNVAWDYNNYRITGNTSDTLTVAGTIDLSNVNPGDTFAIIYGKLVKDTINTPSSGAKTVRLFDSSGNNSFADGDGTYDGVCEACHTQTTYHRNDVSGDHTHNAGLDCMTCHKHTLGFKTACDICHGNPPVVNTPTGGPDGLANDPGATGSLTAGAHDVHVNTKSIGCTVCHYNSVGTGSTHNNGLAVTMGFYLFSGAKQGGSYDGQSGVSYNATTTTPATAVSSNNNKTCSNIYCHSTGQSTVSGSDSTPTYASPIWDDPVSAVCGTCHKVSEGTGLTSGSHEAHLGTTGVAGCAECHTGVENDASAYNSGNHVNASIDVANSYAAGGSPGNGYGKCSTGRCHDDGVGNPKLTPDWGTPGAGCSECHVELPATGSHVKHVTTTTYNTADCDDCHGGAVRNTTAPAQHLDGDIDVYDSSAGDLGYSPDVAKGGAPYENCSTAYCHSTGQSTTDGNSSTPTYATVTWGDTAACGTCHEVNVGSVASGSHNEHLNATGVNGCGDCHAGAADDASSYNSSSHVDGSIDVANTYSLDGTPGNGYGTCSAASCHDDGTGTLVATSVWGTDDANCTSCHDAAPNTGSHASHLAVSGVACNACHDNAIEGTTSPTQHLDNNIDVYNSASGDLGYPENKAKGSAYATCSNIYCHSNVQSADGNAVADTFAIPLWGSLLACDACHGQDAEENDGQPASGSHDKHAGSQAGEYNYACSTCHDNGGDGNTNHVNNTLNMDINSSYGTGASYSQGDHPPGSGGYGSCSTVYCHGSESETWGTDLSAYDTCTKCHGEKTASPTDPQKAPGGSGVDTNGDSAASDAQVGAHQAHMTLPSGYSNQLNSTGNCNECHKVPSAAGDVDHIDSALPAEVYPVTINPEKADLNSVSPNYASGYCTVYCHGASMPGGSNNGSDTAPEWNQTGYLSGTPGDNNDGSGDCEKCHGAPPNTASHSGTETLADCDTCHQHFNNDGTLNNMALHIDGTVQAAADCDSCHAYPPTVGDGRAYQDAPISEGKGAHTTHISNIAAEKGVTLNPATDTYGAGSAAAVCGVCHTNNSANHMTGTRMINFGDGSTAYKFGSSDPSYNGVPGTSSGTTPKTCSNISCHFTTSPAWQDPATAGD